MYREITIVNIPTYEISIPADMQGKQIEILEFEVGNTVTDRNRKKPLSFGERTKQLRFNSGGYKFDRNEANDYPMNYGGD